MNNPSNSARVLAVVPKEMQSRLIRQLAPIGIEPQCITQTSEVAHSFGEDVSYEVVILPATLPNDEWWAVWGELCLLKPRPAILVYSRLASFQLWAGVLEMGGYDLILEPFTDEEIQEAVLRAAKCFRDKLL